MTNQLFGLDRCAVRQDTIYPHQDYEQNNFYKKLSFYFIGWYFRNWKIAASLQLVKNWNISTKVGQNSLFLSTVSTSLRCYAKKIENLEFVRGVDFDFIDSLKNNGTKYLLFFDDSCEKICNSKASVDFATAGIHRGLSTIYIKHNLVHRAN